MVEQTIVPAGTSSTELVDHLPLFVQEVIRALKAHAGSGATPPSSDDGRVAAEHGEQRLRLGFSLDSVVREYGALHDAMVATAQAAGATLTFGEFEVLAHATTTGIANAVVEYSRQRDAELQRQHNEHVAFIAHELRNPLGTATSALHLLKSSRQLPAESREAAALDRSLHRMSELIDHSLTVARVASGIALRLERIRLDQLLEEAETLAVPEAEQKQIAIRVDVDPPSGGECELTLDLRLVRSALSNLVRNAVKYSDPGGLVHLRGRVARDRVYIEVEDCCGGLPPGKVEEAFAPFVRLNSSEAGFGLGLAIAKQAADAHGGAIRVQNLPGKGCIFVLEIPLTPLR